MVHSPASRQRRASAGLAGTPQRALGRVVAEDSLEDRLGRRAARRAPAGAAQDPWLALAELVSRLLQAPAGASTPTLAMPATALEPTAAPPTLAALDVTAATEGEAATAPPVGAAADAAAGAAGAAGAAAPQGAEARLLSGPAPGLAPSVSPPQAPAIAPANAPAGAAAQAAGATPRPAAALQTGLPEAAPARRQAVPMAQPAVDEPAGPGSHRRIVARWRGGVAAAGAGLPQPAVQPRGAAGQALAAGVHQVQQGQADARAGLAAQALASVPPLPELESPPTPPPTNPVPEQTARIGALSNLQLPDDSAPPLLRSPVRALPDVSAPAAGETDAAGRSVGGSLPTLGEVPVEPDLFAVLSNPAARRLAELPVQGPARSAAASEARQLREAMAMLTRSAAPEPRSLPGERVIAPDRGPQRMPPLPAALQLPVAEVVARLLAQGPQATRDALTTLRRSAYPGGVLATQFPEIGSGLGAELGTLMDSELREIAGAADVSAGQLSALVAERRRVLSASTTAASAAATDQGQAAADAVAAEGQRTMDSIAGAADQTDEESLRRQEAASGGADPEAIRQRRDRTLAWIREQVTTQTTHYQLAGERRGADLERVRASQTDAYRALVQREQYQVLTPRPPLRPARDPNDSAREASLADLVNALRLWGEARVSAVNDTMRVKLTATTATTRSHRSDIEAAGDAGIEAARAWAEDRELAGQSWWTRVTTRLRRWIGESRQLQSQWRVRRTQASRDAVALDLQLVNAARAQLEAGVTQDELLADQTLSDQELAVLREYFAPGAEANPLDFAARRLRDNVAAAHLERARQVFEDELVAKPVAAHDFANVEKINQVARAGGADFDAARIAQQLHAAMDQIGTDEARIYANLRGLSRLRGAVVRKQYFAMFGSELDQDLRDELSGDELARAQAALQGHQARADAIALHDAIAGLGTDEAAIMATLRNKTAVEAQAIRDEYLSLYGETLQQALENDLEPGNEIDQANALLRGDTATADAIAIDDAMRGGLTGWGTSEAEIEAVQTRVRAEVLERAQAEQWSSAQMAAEVRRRLAAIEHSFGRRYADVEQYNAPGLPGRTVLARALASELSGPELDMANALQRNDLVAADAARIEIERTGFYASDERLRLVLRSQYERALEVRRLDEGPALQMRVARLVAQLREQRDPVLSEEQISRQRMALERRLQGELEDRAQQDSSVSMAALRDTYQGRYNRISLAYDLEVNTSGADCLAARAMLRQGGRLTPLQEVEFATIGVGTDEDTLRRVLGRATHAEIAQMRAQWQASHPGQRFDDMLRGELSGRDASDIMDMVEHGAPESALQQIAAERRRVDRELDGLTGLLGETAAGNEAAWMRHQRDRLDALVAPLARSDWPDTPAARHEREALMADVEFRVNRVREAVEDHRRRLDSYTEMVTQVVGLTVGLAVATLLSGVSFGALGPVAVAALIAVMSSVAATASTMISKQLVLGGAYGGEDQLTDLAVGVVDALTAAATAGLGARLLRPVRGLVARTRVGDVAGWLGRSGLAQRAARAPGVGGLVQRAGRAVGGRAGLERAAAAFMAEGVQDAVGAVPSSLTQLALNDQTWHGDPLMNFLEGGGTAVLQGLLMGRALALGHGAAGQLWRGGRGRLRMGSEVGRLLEANRLIQEGLQSHLHDNPGASLVDFLNHPDGRRLRAEIDRRGLLPTLDSVSRGALVPAAGQRPAQHVEPNAPLHSAEQASAARAAELASGLPASLREATTVTPDATLSGNSVHVEPRRVGRRIVGVEVRAGPDATPLDIALHAATVQAMQSYRGLLGNVRRALEDVAARVSGSGLSVGSRGWEARLEIGKLPAIIASRMESLPGRLITPELELRLQADLAHLQAQLDQHLQVLADPRLRSAPGRGHVAAEAADTSFANAPRRDAQGRLSAAGEVDLDNAMRALRDARAGHDANAMRRALQAIEALTDVPPMAALEITRLRSAERRELRELLRQIGHADPALDGLAITEMAARVRELTGLDAASIVRLARAPHEFPGAARLLGVALAAPEAPRRAVGKPTTVAEGGEARLQRLVGELQPHSAQPQGSAEPPSSAELIARIATGDAQAQQMLNRNSAAPPHYEVENFNSARLQSCLTQTVRGRQTGTLRIGNGTIEISRGRPTKKNPNPPFHFHGEFPSFEAVGSRVLQFEDGALRIWRAPDGTLMQETIVGARRARAGHETRVLPSYGQAGMRGPRTERAHAHGAGRGPESPFGILHAPVEVNQVLQKRGIEQYLELLRDASPPGVSWHYVTEVRPQTDARRLATVTYRVDVTVRGQRVPFAEFSIHIDPLPDANRRGQVPRGRALRGNDIAWVSPLQFRHHEHPTVDAILGLLRDAADVPAVLQHGLGRGQAASRGQVVQQLSQIDPVAVRHTVQASEGRLRALPPGGATQFDAAAWAQRLGAHFDSGSWARYVVVDLRDLGLNPAQVAQVDAVIAALPRGRARRVLVLR